MGEVIPVAPEVKGGAGDAFDEDILAEIESRLEQDSLAGTSANLAGGQKVELDKADLPADWAPAEPAPAPRVEVDLAEENAPAVEVSLPTEASDQATLGRKKTTWLLAGSGACLLALLGWGAWLWLKPVPQAPLPVSTDSERFRGPVPDPQTVLRVELEPFIVPLGPTKGGAILHLTINLEMADDEAKSEIGQHTRLCRDVIYRLMRGRPVEEIRSPQAKRVLQAQIKTELNHALAKTMVYQVLFIDFVVAG